MHIKKTVLMLVKKYKTTCPFQIAEHKNILVLKEQLGEIYGYYHVYKRIRFIHINSDLNESLQRFVCAHELGHATLHPEVNTPFLRANTLFSVERIEREANKFAVELLLPDEIIYDYKDSNLSIEEIASIFGIPKEVARLKKV